MSAVASMVPRQALRRWPAVAGLTVLLALAAALALAAPAHAASAAVDGPSVQVGLSDRGLLIHAGATGNPPPSCNSPGALNVRAPAGGGLGECDLIEVGTDRWGVSYVDPALGPVTAPCVDYGISPMPCDPYEVPASRYSPLTFTCTPSCTGAATSATATTNFDPGTGGPRGSLRVEHRITQSAHPALAQVDITLRNPTTSTMTDIHYRRVIGALELLAPGSGAPSPYGPATATYSRVWIDGLTTPPAALECSTNGARTGAAPQPTDCLYGVPSAARSAASHCYDDGTAVPAPLAGPGSVTMPPMGTWGAGVIGHLACGQGSLWQFDLGDLAPGASRSFRMYVGGIVGGEPAARAVLTGLPQPAEMWMIAEPGTMDTSVWPTLMLGWRGFYSPAPDFTWTTPTPAWGHLLPSPYEPGITVCLGESAAFTGTVPVGSWAVASSTWDWGDGSPATTIAPGPGAPSHVFTAEGTYTVLLTVTDDHGFPGSVQKTLRVQACPEPVPDNVCPAIAPLQGAILFPGEALHLVLATSDGDRDWRGNPTPDELAVALVVSPDRPASLLFDPATGELSWSPGEGEGGLYTLQFQVRDEACLTTLSIPVRVVPRLPLALDQDMDGTADDQDNCPTVANRDQADWDRDGDGDACGDRSPLARVAPTPVASRLAPDDFDADGILDGADVCMDVPDPAQADLDGDRRGDACDADLDGDGMAQWGTDAFLDNCPDLANPGQADGDGDGVGDACSAVRVTPAPPAVPGGHVEPVRDAGALPLVAAMLALAGLAVRRHRRA